MPKKRTATVEPPPRIETLGDALEKLFDNHRHGCEHESEIWYEAQSEVTRLLEKYGLLGVAMGEGDTGKCHFCGTQEWTLVHKAYCIHRSIEV